MVRDRLAGTVCRQGEADKGRCPVDSGPAERVGHGRLTPDLRGGQDSPPQQGGTRAYGDAPDHPRLVAVDRRTLGSASRTPTTLRRGSQRGLIGVSVVTRFRATTT